MKKLVALLLVIAMCATLFVGCSSEAGGEKGGYKIALCNFSLGETWRYQMLAEFQQAAEQLKAEGVL